VTMMWWWEWSSSSTHRLLIVGSTDTSVFVYTPRLGLGKPRQRLADPGVASTGVGLGAVRGKRVTTRRGRGGWVSWRDKIGSSSIGPGRGRKGNGGGREMDLVINYLLFLVRKKKLSFFLSIIILLLFRCLSGCERDAKILALVLKR
jgi:hypothetical protein